MILTVTINPLLEKRITYDAVTVGKNHRGGSLAYAVGGKGVNVSRQLRAFDTPSMIFTFLGGANGRLIRKLLKEDQFEFFAAPIKGETRLATIAVDSRNETVTTFFEADPVITGQEAGEAIDKLEKMIKNCEILVLSGSSTGGAADNIFPACINTANKYGKVVMLDSYGKHLKACIDEGPTILHNNKSEIVSSLGLSLNNEDDYRTLLTTLYDKGVKQSFITDGGNPTYAASFDFHYKVTNPYIDAVDETGCGDTFLAMIAYGWFTDMVFDDMLKLASAAAAVNASKTNVCRIKPAETEPLKEKVNIATVGKKMKIVDVTPKF